MEGTMYRSKEIENLNKNIIYSHNYRIKFVIWEYLLGASLHVGVFILIYFFVLFSNSIIIERFTVSV